MARYVIYGAGAIGGVVGARLHQSGHEVVLIARGAHLEAIQTHGLTLTTGGEVWVNLDMVVKIYPGDQGGTQLQLFEAMLLHQFFQSSFLLLIHD